MKFNGFAKLCFILANFSQIADAVKIQNEHQGIDDLSLEDALKSVTQGATNHVQIETEAQEGSGLESQSKLTEMLRQ